MRTQYNNQYYKSSGSKGLVFKLFIGVLVLVVCTCISFYKTSLETRFKVGEITVNDSSIVLTMERQEPWLKKIASTFGLKSDALSFLGIDLDKVGEEDYGYVMNEKNENKMIEIDIKEDDNIRVGDTLTVNIDSADGFICIKQNHGNYELVVRKNEQTGEWEKTNWFDSLMHEFKNPWLF